MKSLHIARLDTLAHILGKDITVLQTIGLHIDDHYVEDSRQKKSGETRILHKPRYILKVIQGNIKKRLSFIPLPDCVYGWVKGKSVRSAVEPHRSMRHLYCFDIHSYFDSVHSTHVYKLFTEKLKCSPDVSRILTRLSTYKSCLPQGSPCSPVIANLILFDFDRSMSSYTARRNVRYTRLGDDIIISSNSQLFDINHVVVSGLRRFGLKVNPDKTQKGKPRETGTKVLGVVIGSGISVSRKYRREVRAILHNAQKTGLNPQNRDGRFNMRKHLLGRIVFVEIFNKTEGQYLRKILDNIPD